jgi:hypothetical protein
VRWGFFISARVQKAKRQNLNVRRSRVHHANMNETIEPE